MKAIHNQRQAKTIKKYNHNDKDSPLISKQKEIFSKLADESLEEITELDRKFDSDNLIQRYKGLTAIVKFDEIDNALIDNLLDKTREGKIMVKYYLNRI